MPQRDRTRFLMTTALAATALPVMVSVASAQTAGFSIEIGPSNDPFNAETRVATRVHGPVTEAASAYVRGCRGFVATEAEGVPFDVTETMGRLAFTAAGEGVESLVIGSPDGLFSCALADQQGVAVADMNGAEPGRYTAWIATAEGAQIDARLFAATRPISAIEVFGLDPDMFGEPRAGHFVFSASAESGRQTLAENAELFASQSLQPLGQNNCFGYGQLDAADAVLTLDAASDQFSIFAMSDRDLVISVIAPDGTIHCNDDSYQLNPGVTFNNAEAGDYHVIVGGYSEGGGSQYSLYASEGGPAFLDVTVRADAEPRYGRAVFDIASAGEGQMLTSSAVAANDPLEALPTSGYCTGYSDLSAPDMVLTLDAALPMMSVYAESTTDLTMAVRTPSGEWLCNDDSNALNPAVEVQGAQAGDYAIFVGAYSQGDTGMYTLYTSVGSPNWPGGTQTMPEHMPGLVPGGAPELNAMAEPALGRLEFGPQTRIDPRVIFDIEPSRTEAFGIADGCAGFMTPERPDLVISAEAGLPQLMTYVVSDNDGTLAVVGPDGQIYCNDDFNDLNPGVMIPNPAEGDYAVFVGTYTGNGGLATLGVTINAPVWVMDREH